MTDKKCPECGERLSMDALRCACGWGKREKAGGKQFDYRCTFKSAIARCHYPVGLFIEGNISGWCIFHRQSLAPGQGAEIVRQSETVPYELAIKPFIDGGKRSHSVISTAQDIAQRHGNKPWRDADGGSPWAK